MSDDLVKPKAAIIPCIWDNDGQQYVPVYSHRGVEIANRIEQLESDVEVAEIRLVKAKAFVSDALKRIEQLEAALQHIIDEDMQCTRHPHGATQRGITVFDGYFGGIARAALEGKKDE